MEREMPKIKTKRGAAKRFSLTGTGKIRRRRANHSHILTSKNRKRKRRLRSVTFVHPTDMKNVRKLIPYA